MKSLVAKELFDGLSECAWLYTGAESPPLKEGIQAIGTYMHFRSQGPEGRAQNARTEQACKQGIAKLLGGNSSDIAFLSNSSEAISMIAQALELQRGDNVVITTLEFPSGILPWLLLKQAGVEIRVVDHDSWKITEDDIMRHVDEKTKVVMMSHVSYMTGARFESKKLYDYLKTTNTLFVLDVTQALGVVPVNMNDADFVVCSSYKWLMAIHGLGILGVNPARTAHLKPKMVGWRSVKDMFGGDRFQSFEFMEDARRFEWGYPNYAAIYALERSVNLILQTGVERIERHVLELGGYVLEQMKLLGFERMTPLERTSRAGNLCFKAEHGQRIAEFLQSRGIYIWGGDGRFRVSVHLFNDKQDIDRVIEALAELQQQTIES